MFIFGSDYLNNKPLKVNNVFERSKINIFKVPELKLNDNYELLAPNYPTYPEQYSHNYMCMVTPLKRSVKCEKTQILKLQNHMIK
jgi:hypothetical protein